MAKQYDASLHNQDLAPVPPEQRTWGMWSIAALWVGMSICVPTFTLASSQVNNGMSAWQAVAVIGLANAIVLVPLMLNGHPGTKYGIPFPVLVRASFGVRGANLPAMLRALVACGWFGINCYFGGLGLHACASVLVPSVSLPDLTSWLGIGTGPFVGFVAFWLINVYFIWNGIESIKWMENLAAPFLLVCGVALLVWAIDAGGGLAAVMSQPAKRPLTDTFAVALTSGVSFWATLALNIPDFSRYATSQRAQALGQAISMPTTMALFAFIGVAAAAASQIAFGESINDPTALVTRFDSKLVVGISMFGLALATLSTNIAANVVSPANDFANLAPGKISYRAGGIITAAIGFLMMPWKLLSSIGTYLFTWLIGYGVLLGAIGAIMIVDYFVLRRRTLVVDDLYRRGGAYEYNGGVNRIAIIAFLIGIAPCMPGFVAAVANRPDWVSPLFHDLYTWAWFVSSALAGAVYWVAMRQRISTPPARV